LTSDPETQIFLPSADGLGFTASLVPKSYWVKWDRYASGSWFLDRTIGTQVGDVLCDNVALSTSLPCQNLSIPIQYAGNVTVLLRRLVNGNYSSTFDNAVVNAYAEDSSSGFRWTKYSIEANNTMSVVRLEFSGEIASINSVIVVPTEIYEEAEKRAAQIQDRVILACQASSLYPAEGSSWLNLYNMNVPAPQEWAVQFAKNGSVAGSPDTILLTGGEYDVKTLACKANNSESASLSIRFHSIESSAWFSIPLKISSDFSLGGVGTINLPAGVFNYQIYGENTVFSGVLIESADKNTTNENAVLMLRTSSPTAYAGTVTDGGMVVLSSSYSNLWETYLGSNQRQPLLVNGFSIGMLVSRSQNETNFLFSYFPQYYENVGITTSIASVIVSLLILFRKGRLRK
jgi:hypothetical protein